MILKRVLTVVILMPFHDHVIVYWPLKLNPKGPTWPRLRKAVSTADSQGSLIRTFEDANGWIDILVRGEDGLMKLTKLIKKLDLDSDILEELQRREAREPIPFPVGLANHLFRTG